MHEMLETLPSPSRGKGSAWLVAAAALFLGLSGPLAAQAAPAASDYRARPVGDEIIYFLLPDRFENGDRGNDRGGLAGDRLKTGFDPASKGFYHGGDLKGLVARLDYIQSLGATAVWLGPIFKNKPVQGPPGHESAGYHGYWITDFTRVDPHFGDDADMKTLADEVHRRGMKLYLDIVVNHTADVIQYKECAKRACAYRSRADYPYTRRGGVGGEPINNGFEGDEAKYQSAENFARLTRPDYAYTPFVPKGEEHAKAPEWLNDPIYYHNRGDSTFKGESSQSGDFVGLDDVFTENPRVVQGFIDIYGAWIDRYHVDGFRIDTAKHVNPELWQRFVPAMLDRARAAGIPNFHIFGEVMTGFDPALTAVHTRVDKLPATLDFSFTTAVRETVAGTAPTSRLAELFEDDALYEGGADAALQLPTFVSNHDIGRFAGFIRQAFPKAGDGEVLKRDLLAHAMLLTLRGAPVIYYGDEQGFAGAGGDQDARQDMFASQVASFNAEPVVGGLAGGRARFGRDNPLWREIAELSRLRAATPALRRGRQVTRFAGEAPGLFAVSRIDPETGAEVLVAFNTSTAPISAQVRVDSASTRFASLHGRCAATASAPGSYHVELAPLDFVVCSAGVSR